MLDEDNDGALPHPKRVSKPAAKLRDPDNVEYHAAQPSNFSKPATTKAADENNGMLVYLSGQL